MLTPEASTSESYGSETNPMTWTITHQQAFTTDYTLAGGRAPWDYFFDTWLPSKGWTVTDDERGGIAQGDYPYTWAQSLWKGVQKTFTDALGDTKDVSYIVAVDLDDRHISYYQWDGTVGGGIDVASRYTNTTNANITSSSNPTTWRFLSSDQDTDHWMVFKDSNKIVSYSFPYSQVFLTSSNNQIMPALIRDNDSSAWLESGLDMYGRIGGETFALPAYLLTPNLTWGNATYYNSIAMNTMPDILMKVNGTTASKATLSATNPVSLLIDGTYYMDLAPSASVSYLLETGAADLGVWI